MTAWPSLPRRLLLRLAGAGLAAAPLPAMAQKEGGAPTPALAPTSSIWTEFFKGQRIWAYADRLSMNPGERFNVMAAAGPGQPGRTVRLEVFRLGATGPSPVWTSAFVSIPYRGATASAAAIGPGWPAAFADIDTHGWAPGSTPPTSSNRRRRRATFELASGLSQTPGDRARCSAA